MTTRRLACLAAVAAVGFVALKAMLPATPEAPPDELPTGEKVEAFEYIVNDTERKIGTRRVLVLDLGGGVTMDVVRIRAGKFTMGSPASEEDRRDNEAEHEVTLTNDFYLGRFVVTQAQYESVTAENPSYFKGMQLPVENVTWDAAAAFCTALGAKVKRTVELPSEAQWEFACRAGSTTPFHFGSKLSGDQANVDGSSPYGTEAKGEFKKRTVDVGNYGPNAFGLYDMHGNVWQWSQDYFGPYDWLASTTDPIQLTRFIERYRVLRGGSWASDPGNCRAAYRYSVPPESRTRIGFRVSVRLDR